MHRPVLKRPAAVPTRPTGSQWAGPALSWLSARLWEAYGLNLAAKSVGYRVGSCVAYLRTGDPRSRAVLTSPVEAPAGLMEAGCGEGVRALPLVLPKMRSNVLMFLLCASTLCCYPMLRLLCRASEGGEAREEGNRTMSP